METSFWLAAWKGMSEAAVEECTCQQLSWVTLQPCSHQGVALPSPLPEPSQPAAGKLHAMQSQQMQAPLQGQGWKLPLRQQICHWHKQLESCPKLHKLSFAPLTQEEEMQSDINLPFPRHKDYWKPAEHFPPWGSPAQASGCSSHWVSMVRSCWQQRAAIWHWLRSCLHNGCLLKLQTDKTNDCVERCS